MDNLDRLLEAIEHPERFSEPELQELLSDPETRRLYRLMCASRADAFLKESIPEDTEAGKQWEAFKRSRLKRPLSAWFRHKQSAAVVALLIASCSIIMVGVSLSRGTLRSGGHEGEQSAVAEVTQADEGIRMIPAVNDTVIVFEDETLDKILTKIAPFYYAKVELKSPASSDVRLFLRWDSSTELPELIEQLNSFERINLFLKDDTITDY